MNDTTQQVSLTYDGGWKLLHEIKWALKAANCLRGLQIVLLVCIFWTLVWKL